LGGVYEDIAERLREVVDKEREGLEQARQDAQQSGDQRRQDVTDQSMAEKGLQLDVLPPDLAGQVRELQNYDFESQAAREQFEQLMEELKQELLNTQFNQMMGSMGNVSPEQMQAMKDMFNALNRMLEQRE